MNPLSHDFVMAVFALAGIGFGLWQINGMNQKLKRSIRKRRRAQLATMPLRTNPKLDRERS
jgi:hypothetical protein